MIRLENVNKYFFRHRKNEIHVINNTSLSISENGIVALLGPSGCGKTTLLNVIGGLDKVGKGKIYINGKKITGRRSGAIDKIRTLEIGYVFQNFNLVDSMTVYENVAIALKTTGITDKKEIDEKVSYVLEKVGMTRYKNRYADMLSGGERQRVGIARAIVKNPSIIIADEPTGNLDSRNTLEIMNIIKTISMDKPVILVTHEEKLAKFFADRIVRIRDGAIISDEINNHEDDLDYKIENKIYLKDVKDHKKLQTEDYNIDFYNDSKEQINLDVVMRNGNIYIRTNNPNSRIEIVDDDSGIELVDEHYKKMSREEAREKAFDTEKLKSDKKRKYKSILNPATLIISGFKTVSGYGTLKKILLAGFVASAMFITYAISMAFGVLNVTDDEFAGADKDYLTLVGKNVSAETYEIYESDPDLRYVMPGDSKISLKLMVKDYIQTASYEATMSGSLSDATKVSGSDLVCGRLTESSRELLVDKTVLKDVINDQSGAEVGLIGPKDFLDRPIKVENIGTYTIVGITDRGTPCIYASTDQFISLLAYSGGGEDEYVEEGESEIQFINYYLKKDSVKLTKGSSWPKKDYEVLVNEQHKEDSAYKKGKTINKKINGTKLKVCGYYSDAIDSDYLLVNSRMIEYSLIDTKKNITLCPIDKEQTLSQLKEEGVSVKDTYAESKDKYMKEQWASMRSLLVMAGVILAISFVEIYLMIRASFLSRIRQVGVYRAIGVKKRDIYRMFMGEIIAITALAGVPGFAFMAFILSKLSKVSYLSNMLMVNPTVLAVSILLIFGLNLLFGLLPVWRIIRKTPAQILARKDIN